MTDDEPHIRKLRNLALRVLGVDAVDCLFAATAVQFALEKGPSGNSVESSLLEMKFGGSRELLNYFIGILDRYLSCCDPFDAKPSHVASVEVERNLSTLRQDMVNELVELKVRSERGERKRSLLLTSLKGAEIANRTG